MRTNYSKALIRTSRGFTLVELMVVLVILGVLAAIVVPKFTGRSEEAKLTAAKTDISVIDSALDQFEIQTGRYPTTEEGLAALLQSPNGLKGWSGPYVKGNNVPMDPWGHPYVYLCPGQHNLNGFDLYSLGTDGREGTDDIGNW